jgi:hypothetical protein
MSIKTSSVFKTQNLTRLAANSIASAVKFTSARLARKYARTCESRFFFTPALYTHNSQALLRKSPPGGAYRGAFTPAAAGAKLT